MRSFFLSSLAMLSALVPSAAAVAAESAEPFVASRDAGTFDRSLECLTQAIYFEARSQSDDGQRAVAQVVLNRVRHPAYPNSVCGVVYQGSARSTGCQFTFTCDGSMNRAVDPYAWRRAQEIARSALRGDVYRPVGLATNYHTTAIHPYWAPSLVPQLVLGAHIFYRRPGYSGLADAFTQMPSDDEPGPWSAPRFAAPRTEFRQVERAVRVRYAAMPITEIPVIEQPVLARGLAGRRTTATQAVSRASARPAAVRAVPRVTVQGGVRIFRG